MTLVDGHLAELRASGLDDETIARAGLYSAPERQVRDLLGYGAGPGLVFPYSSLNGEPAYSRVKLDKAGADGKRYRSPTKQPNRLYVPPLLDREILTEAKTPLWITEGEKKCLKAVQEGLPCIAVSGVWSWRTRNTKDRSVPIPDLEHIAWGGRTVYIVYDSDLATKRDVRVAEFALAEELTRRGGKVLAVRLPGEPNGAKVGLDDYLLTHSIDALCALPPVEIEDPATIAGDVAHVRHADDHQLTWPLHDVAVTITALREHSDGVTGEIAVAVKGEEVHWSRLNFASLTSRESLVKRLVGAPPKIPWRPIIERACRLCVQSARQGNPLVILTGAASAPTRELLPRLLYEGEPTQIYGDGDTGKSLVGLTLAVAVHAGVALPFGLKPARAVPAAYFDWETDAGPMNGRLGLIAAGLGIDPPPILYKRMTRPLVAEAPQLAAEIARRGIGFVVIDSKMFAVASGDGAAFHEPITAFYNALRLFAPAATLVLNHVTNADARGNGPARPFGGAFAFNGPRLVWEVKRDKDVTDATAIAFCCTKSNNLPRKPDPFGLRFEPGDGTITVYPFDLKDAAPHVVAGANITYRVRLALATASRTVAELAEALGVAEDTVGRTVRRLAGKGVVVKDAGADGGKAARWRLPT